MRRYKGLDKLGTNNVTALLTDMSTVAMNSFAFRSRNFAGARNSRTPRILACDATMTDTAQVRHRANTISRVPRGRELSRKKNFPRQWTSLAVKLNQMEQVRPVSLEIRIQVQGQ